MLILFQKYIYLLMNIFENFKSDNIIVKTLLMKHKMK